MPPKDPGSKDRESESTAHHTHSSLDPKQAGSVEAPASRFPRLVFPTDALNMLTLATCKDPSVAECFLRAGENQSPKYHGFSFLFLTTLGQKGRRLSEQRPPSVNLQFSFDSEEPAGTVRLLTLQNVVLN